MPLGFSPSAMHRLAHPDGELATSRAAANHNVAMALSSYSTESMENVKAQGASNPYAMQLCVLRDRYTTKQILERAEASGYSAIFLSVDVPLLGRRLNEFRNDFHLPDGMEWPNLLSNGKAELMQGLDDHTQETRNYEFGKKNILSKYQAITLTFVMQIHRSTGILPSLGFDHKPSCRSG